MESHYDINVSLNGSHFFATHPRSIKIESDARDMTKLFREKFPESEGYKVSCTYWEGRGHGCNF